MDSQHRHELEQNDLAEAISGFGQWWAKWGNTVLVVVLILAVSFTVYRYVNLRAQTAHENAWGDLAFESSPGGLQDVARSHSDPTVKAMAYLRAGDLQLAQALAPTPTDVEQVPPPVTGEGDAATPPASEAQPAADPKVALEDAAANYEQAARLAPNSTIKANALLGLASVAESQQKFDDAAQRYREVLDLVGKSQPAIAAQANARLAALDGLRTPVRFAPAPAPGSATTPTPATDADALRPPTVETETTAAPAPAPEAETTAAPVTSEQAPANE